MLEGVLASKLAAEAGFRSMAVLYRHNQPRLESDSRVLRHSGGNWYLTQMFRLCKRLRNRLLERQNERNSPRQTHPPKAKYDRHESHDFAAHILEIDRASWRGVNRRTIVNQSGRCSKYSLFLARAMAVVGYLRQLVDRRMEQKKR